MSENAFINTKNQSHSITADVVVPKQGADGVCWRKAVASVDGRCMLRAASPLHIQLAGPEALQRGVKAKARAGQEHHPL